MSAISITLINNNKYIQLNKSAASLRLITKRNWNRR